MPSSALIERPGTDEYPSFYHRYLEPLVASDGLALLRSQRDETATLLAGIDGALAGHRYAPGKWSVREVLVHMADAERVFSYRALSFARNDPAPLPGFDENEWAPESGAEQRALADVRAELTAVRNATLALFGSLDESRLRRRGNANGADVSVRALAWIIAGHERHHLGILRERYGIGR